MCEEGHWRGIGTYEKDIHQPVQRSGMIVLEQCTECFEYRETDVRNAVGDDDE